ncbi:MAG: SH3 domain-containing protein [Magnetococcales bacterium]|nr:SH3 domain-containing protein [Magnetococcales bacterium]NGZ07053.1 SH3 domain-containing protein [Magnetococcales bacterium]
MNGFFSTAPVRRHPGVGVLLAMGLFMATGDAEAEDRYVTDEQVNLRRSAALSAPVIRTLKAGDKVELLEANSSGWDHVRLSDGSDGWVARRSLSAKIPVEIERNQLKAEIDELRAKLVSHEKLQNELKRIQEVSRNALRIEQENQELIAKANRLEKELKQASDENRILEKQSDTLFFLAGAGVLILGFISGLLSRRRRKSSSYGSLE